MRWKGGKGRAWEALRVYIKRRDGDNCFTCHRSGPEWGWDTGHCWPVSLVGSNNTLSWDERQIARQCKYCNGMGQGMQEVFVARLTDELGADVVAELRSRIHKVDPVKDWDAMRRKFENL